MQFGTQRCSDKMLRKLLQLIIQSHELIYPYSEYEMNQIMRLHVKWVPLSTWRIHHVTVLPSNLSSVRQAMNKHGCKCNAARHSVVFFVELLTLCMRRCDRKLNCSKMCAILIYKLTCLGANIGVFSYCVYVELRVTWGGHITVSTIYKEDC